ncbi:MAG: helix-turn-helix transcriptional regulator, partial [Firmicutes bacterium]|nr:helix-turn-helix transcriptional regulator [Bacillota bacterium]
LKSLRNEHKISQQKLAEAVGVSQQSINKYENYNIEPDINTLIHLAEYFNTSVDYLIGNSELRQVAEVAMSFILTQDETDLVTEYRRLSDSEKEVVRLLLRKYNKD